MAALTRTDVPSAARRRSPSWRCAPGGRRSAASRPLSRRTRWRLLRRRSYGNVTVSSAPPSPCTFSISSSIGVSKEEIPLRQGQLARRLAGQELAVGAHLVGTRIHLDARADVIVHEIRLADGARSPY